LAELTALVGTIDAADDAALEAYLAGPESFSPHPSAEYLAFTCLVMAYDQARLEVEHHRP
jgi:hypothetical protein